jgi:hypothetical protein
VGIEPATAYESRLLIVVWHDPVSEILHIAVEGFNVSKQPIERLRD